MIKVLGDIPKDKFGIACSGGVDSMAILDFLVKGRYNPHVIYFNHNTEYGHEAEVFITEYCKEKSLDLTIGRTELKPTSNKEKIWSDLRYEFFSQFDFPISLVTKIIIDCLPFLSSKSPETHLSKWSF